MTEKIIDEREREAVLFQIKGEIERAYPEHTIEEGSLEEIKGFLGQADHFVQQAEKMRSRATDPKRDWNENYDVLTLKIKAKNQQGTDDGSVPVKLGFKIHLHFRPDDLSKEEKPGILAVIKDGRGEPLHDSAGYDFGGRLTYKEIARIKL